MNLLDNESNQPSKFRTKYWVEINNQSRGKYSVNKNIRLKTKMLKSSLCYYSDVYILVNGRITITGEWADDAEKRLDERDKGVVFKSCAPFINCKTNK